MVIEASHVTIRRLGRAVLQDVSLRIEEGECISVIGPNGAGKSTLMSALLGLLPIASGRVTIDGASVQRLSRRQIARRIAYVPQIHEGYLGFQVRDVIESGRYTYLEPLAGLRDEDERAVRAAAETCRLSALLNRPVQTLSGGERQKAWIAAALAQQAPAMFLDEPTTALDPGHQAELIGVMRDYAAAGQTLVVICHDLNLAHMLGGRCIGLNEGRVVFDGPIETWLTPGHLESLFATRFELHRNADQSRCSIQLAL